VLCNGQLLPINQHQALFSLLGTTFGGDGQTTLALLSTLASRESTSLNRTRDQSSHTTASRSVMTMPEAVTR
jgi:microcystin-dependent protein